MLILTIRYREKVAERIIIMEPTNPQSPIQEPGNNNVDVAQNPEAPQAIAPTPLPQPNHVTTGPIKSSKKPMIALVILIIILAIVAVLYIVIKPKK